MRRIGEAARLARWLTCVSAVLCVVGAPVPCGPATAYGAVGDGKTLNDGAMAAALLACSAAGGGRVSLTIETAVTNSTYLFAAPVRLMSLVMLDVEVGVTLTFTNFSSDWPTKPSLPSYGAGLSYVPLVYGMNVTGAGVAGGGTIDGRGQWWWKQMSKLPHGRPFLLACEGCKRFSLGAVTLTNSPCWTAHLWDNEDVLVDGLRVRNPIHAPNTDGIDIDSSRNVLMRNLDIVTSDDHIAIKSGANAAGRAFGKPSVNVTVEDSKFGLGAGLAIGSEMSGGVYNVTARRLTFGLGAHSVVRIKSARGRGGLMDNITFEDIVAEGVDVPISVQMGYKPGPAPPNGTGPGTPHLGRLVVRNLRAASVFAGELLCLPEAPCDGIVLENVTIVTLGMWRCKNAAPSATDVWPKPRCAK
jgi:polygalacturonase